MPKRKSNTDDVQQEDSTYESRSVSKQAKKTKDDDDGNLSQQRARKRALDRVAQRTIREKTKKYIAYLEQTVDACKADNEPETVRRLLVHNAELFLQTECLRKMVTDIASIVNPETLPDSLQKPPQRALSSPIANSSMDIGLADGLDGMGTILVEPPGVAGNPATLINDILQAAGADQYPKSQRDHIPDLSEHYFYNTGGNYHDSPSTWVMQDDLLDGNVPKRSLYMIPGLTDIDGFQIGPTDRGELLNTLHSHVIPVAQMLPPGASPKQEMITLSAQPGNLWQIANTIFSKIFWVDSSQAREADEFNGGLIFQALAKGWDSLFEADRNNPVVKILREYDETLWEGFDPVNRLAIAYKNQYLIKYFLNSNPVNLRRIPEWARPQQFSRVKKHPMGVYFFAWPGLRDRLICGYPNASMEDFSAAFQRHFRFDWPFSLEDTYQVDVGTGNHYPSPLFERYHRDLKYWTMDPAFFRQFPETAEDILSPRGSGSPPKLGNSTSLALMRLPQAESSTEGGSARDFEDHGGRSTSNGFPPPAHWVSQVIEGYLDLT